MGKVHQLVRKKDKTPFPLKAIRWGYPKLEKVLPFVAHRIFLNLFFTPFKYNSPAKEEKAKSFGEEFTITAAGKKIQCYRWGEADKMVFFIHGWAGRATQFRRFVKPLLKAGYSMIAFDGPAHGASAGKSTNIVEFEEVLKALYAEVGKPEAFITHSFGGGVALFAAMNGLPIKTIINIASPTIGDKIIDTYLEAIGASIKTKDYFKAKILKKYGKPFEAYTALHFIQHLKQDINLLLVHDENDKEVSLEHPGALLQYYPKAQLYKTSGLGHTRILKDNEVIKKCIEFILLAE
jgi:esterase/lipase